MARFPENGSGTQTVKAPVHDGSTNPIPDQTRDFEDTPPPTEDRTAALVKRMERGDRKIKDQYEAPDETSNETGKTEAAAALRREIAERVSKAVGKVMSSCGTVRMAADLELLKRELSRCHDVLRPHPTEGDFLSIVVLVESELGIKPWRDISKQELAALKSAIDLGVKLPRVTFDEFNRTFRTLNASGWATGPKLELGEVGEDLEEEEPPND
jgi:hypothetical protein